MLHTSDASLSWSNRYYCIDFILRALNHEFIIKKKKSSPRSPRAWSWLVRMACSTGCFLDLPGGFLVGLYYFLGLFRWSGTLRWAASLSADLRGLTWRWAETHFGSMAWMGQIAQRFRCNFWGGAYPSKSMGKKPWFFAIVIRWCIGFIKMRGVAGQTSFFHSVLMS